jgi:hypothetical protein
MTGARPQNFVSSLWLKALRNREVSLLSGLIVLAIVVGAGVQLVFPATSRALIVLGDEAGVLSSGTAQTGWFMEYEYVAGPDISDTPGSGRVYEMQLLGDPLKILSKLGTVFDVPGEPTKSLYFDEFWPGYVLGPEDWSGPTLNLTWNGTGSWYYSNPAAYQNPVCRRATEPGGQEESSVSECENPEPRGPLPSVSEARTMAAELFSRSGFTVSPADITVLADDDWGVGLSALVQVEGSPTALEWSVFYAPGPTLASVSGHAAIPVSRGVFSTLSPRGAMERLTSGQWWGSAAPLYHFGLMSGVGEGNLEGDTSQPEPGDVIILRVESTEPAHLLVWDSRGTAWIVPGYLMRHGVEPWNSSAVISLEEGVIEFPEPVMVGIMPAL